ncbi:MAG: RNA polymerase sigma factor [Clostridiales bacterium]|nr:RNA polymerase sigma factor [Clostridiales bacterium]
MLNKMGDIDQTEKELIQKAKQGDQDSFEALILSCKEKAYNIALRYMQNEEDALDAVQESFIKIFRHLPKFNEQSRFDTWVYRIVVNACNDMLRKSKKMKVIDTVYKNEEDEDIAFEIADKAPGPDGLLEKKEESEYIVQCLDKLSTEYKEVLILRDLNGFSYDEIASILDCSIGTVKSKISRARQKFKDIYLLKRVI